MSVARFANRFLAVVVVLLVTTVPGAAATFTVTSNADTPDAAPGNGTCATAANVCTLRAALQEANATTAPDTITFAIASGPQRITLGAKLPDVTSPAVIDGTTQPGYANKPIIEVYGANRQMAGLTITAGNTTVRRLVINGFNGNGISIVGNGGNVIERSYIGTDIAGTAAVENRGSGILVSQSSNNIIQYNLLSGNGSQGNTGGLELDVASNTLVVGNLIGTDITGLVRLRNDGRGIAVKNSSNNTFRGNVISGNWGSGFRIYSGSTGNLVEGNYVGVGIDKTLRGIGNWAGVQIRSDNNTVRNNLIAASEDSGVLIWDGASGNLVQNNTIAYNHQHGVAVLAGGTGNRVTMNSIYSNGLLGIELSEVYGLDPNSLTPADSPLTDGVDANDFGDSDNGTNLLQNYPVLNSATFANGMTQIDFSINTTADTALRIEFYASPSCDDSGHGQGTTPLGSMGLTTDATGSASQSVFAVADLRGQVLAAIAIDPNGNTSEFSACRLVN